MSDGRALAAMPSLPTPPSEPGGLTSAEAARRVEADGANDPAPARRRSRFVELALLFANPLVVILLVAGIISAVLGERVNAALIIGMVALSVIVNFVQTWRSQRAVERLRETVAPTATVVRDGRPQELARRLVVVGDVIRLAAGDLVPADAELVAARDLHLHEAALTGESIPVEKRPGEAIFLGTSVVSGAGAACVRVTGARTQFGQIAARLSERAPETAFERGLRRFGMLILRAVFFLVLFIVVVDLALHRPALESMLFAVALAVGLTPEFLPMITTVTLGAGAVRMARDKVIVKHLPAIQNFGSIDVLCSDKTGTLTSGHMVLVRSVDALGGDSPAPLRIAAVNSRLETGIKSPLDDAILAAATTDDARAEKLDEIPFDFERRRASIVVATASAPLLICKGAPEGILAAAIAYRDGSDVVPLDDERRARCERLFAEISARGQRALAVATRTLPLRAAYTAADERELVLVGLLAFADPPRPDARDAIAALAADGVAVKIVTGDNELVARHVCSEVGLDAAEVVLGADLDRMTDGALGHVAERATVFARVSPAQKNRIILALKRRGHVVGYLGDGINDAPSLHAADVGISVASAVDVARDAAEIILLEPGLRVLHAGILAGRHAFGNVMKYLLMGTSSNFGNMLSMAGASLFLPFLPMLPTQILLNNFLYDLAQVTIPTDRVDDSFVRRPQRWDIGVIRRFMLFVGPVSSVYDFLTFWVLLRVFRAGEAAFHTGWFVESLATQTLVLFVIRTAGHPLRSRPSAALAATTVAIAIAGVVLPYTPVAPVLGFVPLPASFFAFLAFATLTYLALVELVKRRVLRGRIHGASSEAG